jgi:hypothetical protein
MGVLDAFLHPIAVEETKKVEISKRFVGEDGKPVPFEIKTIPQGENSQLIKKYTRRKLVNGTTTEIFDTAAYTNALIVECTVQPDFQDSRMCEAYGVLAVNGGVGYTDKHGNEKILGVRLGDTALYKENLAVSQVLPEDTVLCLMSPYFVGKSSNLDEYQKAVDYFAALAGIK